MADAEYTEKKRAAFCAVKAAMDMLVAVTEPKCGTSLLPKDVSRFTPGLPQPPPHPYAIPPPTPANANAENSANYLRLIKPFIDKIDTATTTAELDKIKQNLGSFVGTGLTHKKFDELSIKIDTRKQELAAAGAANSVSASPAVTMTLPAATSNAVSAANAATPIWMKPKASQKAKNITNAVTNAENAAANANYKKRSATASVGFFTTKIQQADTTQQLDNINGLLEQKKKDLTELQISQLKDLIEQRKIIVNTTRALSLPTATNRSRLVSSPSNRRLTRGKPRYVRTSLSSTPRTSLSSTPEETSENLNQNAGRRKTRKRR